MQPLKPACWRAEHLLSITVSASGFSPGTEHESILVREKQGGCQCCPVPCIPCSLLKRWGPSTGDFTWLHSLLPGGVSTSLLAVCSPGEHPASPSFEDEVLADVLAGGLESLRPGLVPVAAACLEHYWGHCALGACTDPAGGSEYPCLHTTSWPAPSWTPVRQRRGTEPPLHEILDSWLNEGMIKNSLLYSPPTLSSSRGKKKRKKNYIYCCDFEHLIWKVGRLKAPAVLSPSGKRVRAAHSVMTRCLKPVASILGFWDSEAAGLLLKHGTGTSASQIYPHGNHHYTRCLMFLHLLL